ncbi:MAG: lipoprotein 17-related variable surface protein [Mycoplasmoidaceae bacterium]
MKKKIFISLSLLIGLSFSIFPLNFIMNNNSYETNKIENEIVEEISPASNILNESDIGNANVFYDKSYTTLFTNNFTNPVVSPNIEIPGFLGAWDTTKIDTFPNAIGWTTSNLFQSWSANLIDHPSLDGQVPSGFSPGLVTALHSDNKYSRIKRNQVFAIVANTSNLTAREYWILRYNTIDGSPILDNNSKMPIMEKAPLPEKTAINGNGSAFSLTHDTVDDRYLAFYSGRLEDFKNDIFGFKLTVDNKIQWLENDIYFDGHKDWDIWSPDYFFNNIVLGITSFNNQRAPDGTSLAIIVGIPTNSLVYVFKTLNLKDDLSISQSFKSTLIYDNKIINSPYEVQIPFGSLTPEELKKNINPNLQLYPFQDNFGNTTHKVQMVLPIIKDGRWNYVYLSSIFDVNQNTYITTSLGNRGYSQLSFFTSDFLSANDMPPNISYNDENPEEIIITSLSSSSNNSRFSANQFKFQTTPPDDFWDPTQLNLTDITQTESVNWKSKNTVIKYPYGEDVYLWSFQGGSTNQFIMEPTYKELQKWGKGGIEHDDFQSTASALQWLEGQSNTKLPSEITNEELQTIGTGNNNFFKIPNLSYTNVTSSIKLEVYGQPIRDDKNGTIQGIFNIIQDLVKDGVTYNFKSKIPFEVIGLNYKNDVPTSIIEKSSILNQLPSELTSANISNFVDVIAPPPKAVLSNWAVTNQNNAAGTITISVNINPHFDQNGRLVNSSKLLNKNVTGLRKISGTRAVKSTAIIPSNKTVWDFTILEAPNFIEVKDLIPNSDINDVSYLIRDYKPLIGELTIVTIVDPGSYYNPNNNGLPSTASDPPLELPIIFQGFKKILGGTIVIPGTGPYVDILPSSINENNIIDYITIENMFPGSIYTFSNITPNDKSNNSSEWFVSFDIVFDKEYDTNGYIINGQKKTYQIRGFEIERVTEENNFIPIIAGSVGGGIFLLLSFLLLIFLLMRRKKSSKSDYTPQPSEIVFPLQSNQEQIYQQNQTQEVDLENKNDDEYKDLPPRIISKDPRKTPFSGVPYSPEMSRLKPSPPPRRPVTSNISKSPKSNTPFKR